MTSLRAVPSLIIGTLTIGCRGTEVEPSGPPVAEVLTLLSGTDQTGLVGEVLEGHLAVRVTDREGRWVGGAEVEWSGTDGTICFPAQTQCHSTPVVQRTDGAGIARVWYRPGKLGSSVATASVPSLAASTVTFSLNTTGILIKLNSECDVPREAVSFSDPSGLSTSFIPRGTEVVWQFTTSDDCAARIVSATIPPGGMIFDSNTLHASGRFSFTPNVAGTWTYTDLVSGATGTLIISGGSSGEPADRIPSTIRPVSGEEQTGLAGAVFDQQFTVRVTNVRGAGVDSVPVTWADNVGGALCFPLPHECHFAPVTVFTDALGYSRVWFRPQAIRKGTLSASVGPLAGSPVGFPVDVNGVLIRLHRPECDPSKDEARFMDPGGQSGVTVPLGSAVAWELESSEICSARIVSTSMPPGGHAFESGVLSSGRRYGFVPNVTGTWEFTDLESGAVGWLTVTPSGSGEPEPGTPMVYIASASGFDMRALAAGESPAWSPDGRRLAYVVQGNVHIYDFTSGAEAVLAAGFSPSWSPEGDSLLVVTEEGIVMMQREGSGMRLVLRHGAPLGYGGVWLPVCSPDGSRIAYVDAGDFDMVPQQIYLMNRDGTGIRRLTSAAGDQYPESDPAWSPDGKEIAFTSWAHGLATIPAAGGAIRTIFRGETAHQPAWSPDGRTILFTDRYGLQAGIWSVSREGGMPVLVIERASDPALSPDGRRIAFVR